MRTSHWSVTSAMMLGLLAGCTLNGGGSDTPMETTGPNQVVIKVPGMT